MFTVALMSRRLIVWILSSAVLLFPNTLSAQSADTHQHHSSFGPAGTQTASVSGLKIPDVGLVDQNGNMVHFYSDLVKGKIVAINTIFTTCTTICPVMGAHFSQLSKLLGADAAKVNLLSISIDPIADSPQRLKQWSREFGQAGPNWTLLTGKKADVDALLKALQVFAADKQNHAPAVLIGGEGLRDWTRTSGLDSPASLAVLIRNRLRAEGVAPATPKLAKPVALRSTAAVGLQAPAQRGGDPLSAAALEYFTDVRLVTQSGSSVRLYSDLLKDKIVVINAFFATCKDVCPIVSGVLANLQDRLGDHLGKDVVFLSFSVDPEVDTPEKLKKYAESFRAKPGWLFLTGEKENVELALSKLGQKVARKEDHMAMFIIGNNKTGLWKKVLAPTATADSLKVIVESVINDKG